MAKEYYREKDAKNFERLQGLLSELPPFCREFFIGVAQKTTVLTRLNYAYDLKIFFAFLTENVRPFLERPLKTFLIYDLKKVKVENVELYLSYLENFRRNGEMHTNSAEAKARKLSTLRSFFRYFYNKGKLQCDVTAKVSTPKRRDKPIVRLEIDEVVKLLDAAELGAENLTPRQLAFNKITRVRDVAVLTLFLGTGIRISELAGLNISDFDFNSNQFTVTRKGGKQDILYFGEEVASALQTYKTERLEIKTTEAAMFLSIQNKRLGVRALENLVKKYAGAVTLKHITPHKLRSTYGTNLYRETGDIYVVAEVLGHKDVNTTKKHYAAISEDIKRNAATKVVLRDEHK